MIEPEITVTLSVTENTNEGYKRNFYDLELERNKIMYLPTMWTIVHPLTDKSPLHKYSNEELRSLDADLYILLQYHDESFSQKLFRIYNYKFDKLLLDVQFEPSFSYDEEGYVVLDHDKLHNTNRLD